MFQTLKSITLPPKQGTTAAVVSNKSFQYNYEVRHTDVIEELVVLAGKHTKLLAQYKRDEGFGVRQGTVSVETCPEDRFFKFCNELKRLQGLITKPLDEPILGDHEPVHQGYMYVADSKPRMFIDGMNMTVGRWKALRGDLAVREVRRCDMTGRALRLPEEVKEEQVKVTQLPRRWDASGHTIRQAKRRPRSSHKIKKVQ